MAHLPVTIPTPAEARPAGDYGLHGDSLFYSLGSTLVQSAGHSWNLLIRYMEINRTGVPNSPHPLFATLQDWFDLLLTRHRKTAFGRYSVGPVSRNVDSGLTGESSDDVTALIQWMRE
jgi:hypothetical protein